MSKLRLTSGTERGLQGGRTWSRSRDQERGLRRSSRFDLPRRTQPELTTPRHRSPGHPPTYMVREERLLAAVDSWLGILTNPDHLDTTIATIVAADKKTEAEPAEVTRSTSSGTAPRS